MGIPHVLHRRKGTVGRPNSSARHGTQTGREETEKGEKITRTDMCEFFTQRYTYFSCALRILVVLSFSAETYLQASYQSKGDKRMAVVLLAVPPNRNNIRFEEFKCPLRGGVAIGKQVCVETCTGKKGEKFSAVCVAQKCESPFRVCSSCASEGVTDDKSRVTNPRTGLCAFHDENGARAIRFPPDVPPPVQEKKKESAVSLRGKALAWRQTRILPPPPKGVSEQLPPPVKKAQSEAYSEDPIVRAFAVKNLLLEGKEPNLKKVGALLQMDENIVRNHVRFLALCDDVHREMRVPESGEEPRLLPTTALCLVGYPDDFQKKMLKEIVRYDMTADVAKDFVRRHARKERVTPEQFNFLGVLERVKDRKIGS